MQLALNPVPQSPTTHTPSVMFRSLIIITLSAQLLSAQETTPPVSQGKFYHLWFGNGQAGQTSGMLIPETSIEVLSIRGNWVEVTKISDAAYAQAMWVLSEVKRDTEIGKRFIEETGKNRESFLKEAEKEPVAPWATKRMWINLDRVAGLQEIGLKR
jgi:hypothetical protein